MGTPHPLCRFGIASRAEVRQLSSSFSRETLGYGVSGGQQVGCGYTSGESDDHALLWSGTAGNPVNLNPSMVVADTALSWRMDVLRL